MCRFPIERISDRPQGTEIIQTVQVRRSNYLHPFVFYVFPITFIGIVHLTQVVYWFDRRFVSHFISHFMRDRCAIDWAHHWREFYYAYFARPYSTCLEWIWRRKSNDISEASTNNGDNRDQHLRWIKYKIFMDTECLNVSHIWLNSAIN